MKPLKLPQSKLARFGLNVGLIVVWLICYSVLMDWLYFWALGNSYSLAQLLEFGPKIGPYTFSITKFLVCFFPIILGSRYIWTGRVRPRPKITSSMDD